MVETRPKVRSLCCCGTFTLGSANENAESLSTPAFHDGCRRTAQGDRDDGVHSTRVIAPCVMHMRKRGGSPLTAASRAKVRVCSCQVTRIDASG